MPTVVGSLEDAPARASRERATGACAAVGPATLPAGEAP